MRRLDARLFLSYALVVLVGAATFTVTFVLVAPTAFDNRMGGTGMMGGGRSDSHTAFVSAIWVALPVALLVSILTAAIVAAFVTRRILRPVEAVRRATARLGAGHYDERVEMPDEPELAALAEDVNRLAAALQETETRRARLVGEVAHEMRTPLTTIDGYVEGILDGVFPADEETLTSIQQETTRLARLAADLSALSRAEEGAVELTPVMTDLAALAESAAERLRPQFAGKGVALTVDAAGSVPALADEARTLQILTNLIGNALTYTPTGGAVRVRVVGTPVRSTIAVVDTGIGLTAEQCERVFDRFYRAPGIERPPGGSGIGLTIARSLARAQRGDVRATSPGPGQGCTFTLDLPTG